MAGYKVVHTITQRIATGTATTGRVPVASSVNGDQSNITKSLKNIMSSHITHICAAEDCSNNGTQCCAGCK